MIDYFDQGLAEFNTYEAVIPRYGEPRKASVVHVWVKEPWDAEKGVKAAGEKPSDFEVLKLNQIISYPTGMYRYEQMWSGFWRRDTGALVKYTLSHHEACGATFKRGDLRDGKLLYQAHSYFEGEGEIRREQKLPSDAVFYDELPLRMRVVVAGGLKEGQMNLLRSIIDGRASRDDTPAASATWLAIKPTKEGEPGQTTMIEIRHAEGVDRMTFESVKPWKLLRWEQASGSLLVLKESTFVDYWNRNRNSDQAE